MGVRLAHLACVLLAATLGLPMSASGQTAEEKERVLRNISEGVTRQSDVDRFGS